MSVLITIYLAIAAFAAVWAYNGGALHGPQVKVLTVAEHVVLASVAIVAGIFWVLFLPSLVVLAFRGAKRFPGRGRHGLPISTRGVRVRS